jgi:aminopeptidase
MNFDSMSFPPFSLSRLLTTVFAPKSGERVAVLIDLEDTSLMKDFAFLKEDALTIQRQAHDVFYLGLKNGVSEELGLTGGDIFAYKRTGGSNLDLPDEAYDAEGKQYSFEKDIYPHYNILLCISTDSATAPLTAFAKQFGFRGATLHGLNDIILNSGLAVDYNIISKEAEKLRAALTKADAFQMDFEVEGQSMTLELMAGQQEAQKSHGLCHGEVPDVANLPAGEVYFVPTGGQGQFPMKYEGGTIGIMDVADGSIQKATLLKGDADIIEAHNAKLASDPVTGVLGELGFGTQVLPVSGKDIQDEKILGTMHVATGRSDHLGGDLTPDKFAKKLNATHDDILFSPSKTPEILVKQVRMIRDGQSTVVLENFQTAEYLSKAIQ